MNVGLTITIIWVLIFIVDNFLEHRLGFRYISWKFQKEVVLKPFYFRWQNSKLGNKTFYDYNFNLKSKKYNHWFNCGIFATIVLCIYGYSLFIPPVFHFFREYNFFDYLKSKSSSPGPSQPNIDNTLKQSSVYNDFSLSIGVPGYNIPWSHTILVFIALVIAGLIHEFGHALAAALEKISINGAGAFLTFIFPGAFVNISSIELSNCDLLPRMRILCAGVWHNLFLCVLMVSMVKYVLPAFFKLGYYRGICVIDMPRVLRGGIIPGDSILQINSCFAADYSLEEFESCLLKEEANDYGTCIPNKNITTGHYTANLEMTNVNQYNAINNKNPVNFGSYMSCDICDTDRHTLCYSEYLASSDTKSGHKDSENSLKVCLNVRQALLSSRCNSNKECSETFTCMKLNHARNQKLISVVIGNKKPHDAKEPSNKEAGRSSSSSNSNNNNNNKGSSSSSSNSKSAGDASNSESEDLNSHSSHSAEENLGGSSSALSKSFSQKAEYTPLLYFGSMRTFLGEMILTNYCSRVPVLLPTFLPDLLIMLFKYLFSISGGLMIVNSMPCYGLDGYLVMEHLLESMYGINERVRKMFLVVITSVTTFLVGLNLLLSIVVTS